VSTILSPQVRTKKRCIDLANHSVVDVAAGADVPRSTLYQYLDGKPKHILHEHLLSLARFLGCSTEDLAQQYASIREHNLVELKSDEHIYSYQSGDEEMYDRNIPRRAFNRVVIQGLFAFPGLSMVLSSLGILDIQIWDHLRRAVESPHHLNEETVVRFEQLTAKCWELSDGSKLNEVEQLLSTYLSPMADLARQTSAYQRRVASIVSQCYQLMYIVSSHEEDFKTALSHGRKAQFYAQIAGDANLEGASLIRQGVTHLHRKSPHETLLSYQEALLLAVNLSPLLRSRLYADMSEVQGKLQMEQEARYSIGLSAESFPENPSLDPAYRYIHFNKSSIPLHQGLALLDLHHPAEAADVFAQIDGLHPKLPISLRSQVDVLNQQSYAAIALGDLEQFKLYLEAAVPTALRLGSDLRKSEAWDVYTRALAKWPQEQQVKALANLFQKRSH